MYNYFISYNYSFPTDMGTSTGFGNWMCTTDKPILIINDIRKIEKEIERKAGFPKGSVIIINYREM